MSLWLVMAWLIAAKADLPPSRGSATASLAGAFGGGGKVGVYDISDDYVRVRRVDAISNRTGNRAASRGLCVTTTSTFCWR